MSTIGVLEGRYERIQIAGSLLRGRPEVGDLELLYIPRWEERINVLPNPKADLWGGPISVEEKVRVDLVGAWFREDLEREGAMFEKRLNKLGSPAGFGEQNKYLVHRETGLPVDVFTTEARYWGMALFVRTGPAEWNIAAMAALRRLGKRGHMSGGIFRPDRGLIDCPTEEVVFEELGLRWLAPNERDLWILQRIG